MLKLMAKKKCVLKLMAKKKLTILLSKFFVHFDLFKYRKCLHLSNALMRKYLLSTVVPTENDSDVIFCLQLLSKILTCTLYLS